MTAARQGDHRCFGRLGNNSASFQVFVAAFGVEVEVTSVERDRRTIRADFYEFPDDRKHPFVTRLLLLCRAEALRVKFECFVDALRNLFTVEIRASVALEGDLSLLEANGVVLRSTAADPAPVRLNGLTDWGYAAEPIMQALGHWAAASPLHDPTLPLSPVSYMLSLPTMLDAVAAAEMNVVAVFRIGTAHFTAHLSGGETPVTRGAANAPDLRFEAPAAPPLAGVFYTDAAPEAFGLHVIGAPDLLRKFISLFNLPSPHAA